MHKSIICSYYASNKIYEACGMKNKYCQFSTDQKTKFPTLSAIGLVEKFPSNVQPYLKLMRLHAPIGFLLVYWPAAWSVCLLAPAGHLPNVGLLAMFLLGAISTRGAGCTINDMLDRKLDRKVERTKDRPLASGAISMLDAWVLLAGQLGISAFALMQLNSYSLVVSCSALIPISLYPLAKRICSWPQLCLGLTFNWGVFIAWAEVTQFANWISCLSLYFSCVCWTLFYDTIYAFQDKKDDLKVGIKSTAITFGKNSTTMLGYFATAMTSGLVVSGLTLDQTWPYYLSVGVVSGHLIKQILTLKPNDIKDCGHKFKSNNQIGLILISGIILGTLLKDSKSPLEDNLL